MWFWNEMKSVYKRNPLVVTMELITTLFIAWLFLAVMFSF